VTVYTFTATPIFEARTRLLIEAENQNVVAFKEVVDEDQTKADYYQTQYNILQSRVLARRTLEQLKLWETAPFGGPVDDRFSVKKIVLVQSNVPGTAYIQQGPELITKDAGKPFEGLKENVPIQDANSVAIQAVQAAGGNGGIVLDFTPPEALKILQAAQRLGLQNRVKWACSTPCNTDFLAQALGSQWDGKLGVNAELNLTTASGPDSQLYRDVLKKYAPKIPLGSFSQMGFTEARIATDALLGVKGAYTPTSVNAAFKGVKDFKTDILCKPWYYGSAPLHIPNNTDRTTTPKGGVMVEKEGCFAISDVDPAIAQVRKIEAGGGNAS